MQDFWSREPNLKFTHIRLMSYLHDLSLLPPSDLLMNSVQYHIWNLPNPLKKYLFLEKATQAIFHQINKTSASGKLNQS